MARQENAFALLDEEDAEDVITVLAHVEAKLSSKQQQQMEPEPETLPLSDAVRTERGRGGRGGRGTGRGGRGSGSYGRFGDGETVGLEARGGGRGGRRGRGGRGRGFYEEDRGSDKENRVYLAKENLEDGLEGGSEFKGEWSSVNRRRGEENRYPDRDRRGYGGGSRGFRGGEGHQYGDRNWGRYNKVESEVMAEKKEEAGEEEKQAENKESSGNGGNGWVQPELVVTETPRKTEEKQLEPEKTVSEDVSEKKALEEEDKEMTLEEYEKILFEKRKAIELPKTIERKVDEKEFVGMQVVDRKKDGDLFVKPAEKEKLKKKESFDKEEKARKVVSINEFLKPADGKSYYGPSYGRGRGRGHGRGERGATRTGFVEQSVANGFTWGHGDHGRHGASLAGGSSRREFTRSDHDGHRGGFSRRVDDEHYTHGFIQQASSIPLEDPGQFPVLG